MSSKSKKEMKGWFRENLKGTTIAHFYLSGKSVCGFKPTARELIKIDPEKFPAHKICQECKANTEKGE